MPDIGDFRLFEALGHIGAVGGHMCERGALGGRGSHEFGFSDDAKISLARNSKNSVKDP